MRAFTSAWRAIVSCYSDLYYLIGASLLWWVTGGLAVALAMVAGYILLQGGPVWVAPLIAIPAGPASAALAYVARRCARQRHVDRDVYFEGYRLYWRKALALSAISMGTLSLIVLNVFFYLNSTSSTVQLIAIFFVYLLLVWGGIQSLLYPTLVGLKTPAIGAALRTSAVVTLGNPLFSTLLFVIAIAMTALSIVVTILLLFLWPAYIALLGEHGLITIMQRAGIEIDD